jgi:NTE family protein
MEKNNSDRVAIACQGGGSHTAFTAGVLKKILQKQSENKFEIVALSGTSGGAICAFLTWYGILQGNTDISIALLDSFWHDNSTNSYFETFVNAAIILQSQSTCVEFNPYLFPELAREKLEATLSKLVNFDDIPKLNRKNSPQLLVGAVDILKGKFKTFNNQEVTLDALLASAAIPSIFRAVQIEKDFYWDGLFSQNPPIRDLAKLKPNKLWVIQINPPTREKEPKTMEDIRDRRNELSGNLSLEQELYFINKINELVSKRLLTKSDYTEILVQKVIMDKDLSYSSKLDRNPLFIKELMEYGEKKAEDLFNR